MNMRMSRFASAADWRYAAGELVLIVIGVSIALAATSWYEDSEERRDERRVLQQLHRTLGEDLEAITSTWEMTRQRERSLTMLLEYLESGRPYSDDLATHFQALWGWRTVRITKAPFEALKLQGYQLISDATLRQMLIAFYEDHYAKLEYNSLLDRDFAIDKVQPYYLVNFVMTMEGRADVDGGTQAWVPKDYERIREERYVANLCRFRADILRRFVLRDYETTTAAIRDILAIIDRKLGE